MSGRLEFCAVMAAAAAEAALRAPWAQGAGLSAQTHGDLAALHVAIPGRGLRALLGGKAARRAAGAAMVDRLRLLERLAEAGDVLPASPGVTLEAPEAVATLAANAATLATTLSGLAGYAQAQVRIALAGDAQDRARLAAEAAARIAAVVEQCAALPPDGPEGALNLVCLTNAAQAAALEATLTALDAEWAGAPAIRLIGPSPAIYFAAAHVERPTAAAIAAAAGRLGLPADLDDPSAVKPAFAARARALAPDLGGAATLDALRAASVLMTRAAGARRALAAAGLPAIGPCPPLIGVRSEAAAQPGRAAA